MWYFIKVEILLNFFNFFYLKKDKFKFIVFY